MQDWPTVRFGDVVQKMNGKIDLEERVGKLCVRGEHIPRELPSAVEHIVVDDNYLGPAFHRTFEVGDVLFATRFPNLNKVGCPKFSGVCANTTLVLRSKDDILLQEFLPYLMKQIEFVRHCKMYTRGSTNPYINWSQLANYTFALPPIKTQKNFSLVMDSIYTLYQQNVKLLNLCSNVETKMSKRFFTNRRSEKLSDLAQKVKVGIVVKPSTLYCSNKSDGIPVIKAENIIGKEITHEIHNSITFEANEANKKSIVREGDVVIVRRGEVGEAAVVTSDLDGRNVIDLIIVKCGPDLLPEYLASYLNSPFGVQKITSLTSGGVIKFLSTKSIEKMKIPISSKANQRYIWSKLDEISKFKKGICEYLGRLTQIMQALISDPTIYLEFSNIYPKNQMEVSE